MKIKNLILICACIAALLGCKHAQKPIVIESLTRPGNPTMITNDDVTERSYMFGNVPLQFMFSDSTASYVLYASTRKKISDIFYTREMAEKNAPRLAAHYTIDRESFIYEPERSTLMEAAQITIGNHKYVLCSFDKQRFRLGPLIPTYNFLLDVTDENNVTAIAFTALVAEGDFMPKVYGKNGRIFVDLTYYSHLKAGDYSVETTAVTQDDGNWVME